MGVGDELMVTGRVRDMQLADQRHRKVRLEYGKRMWNLVFDHNPRIAHENEKGEVQVLEARPGGLRPYIERKTSTRWEWRDYRPPRGELFLQADELAYSQRFPGRVILEPNNKGSASPNKDWGWERWLELSKLLLAEHLSVAQMGLNDARRLPRVEFIHTPNFRWAAAIIARARLAILPEGGLHHAAAVFGTPAVVIYGGYISPRQTGYDGQVALFTGGAPCGMRVHCDHCAAAMAAIQPEQVARNALELLREKVKA